MMRLSEHRRSELFQAVSGALGEEHAVSLFEMLPPPEADLATTADIESLRASTTADIESLRASTTADIEALRASTSADIELLRVSTHADLESIRAEIATMSARFDARIDAQIGGLRDELLAAFRGELVTAVAGQTRMVVLAIATTIVGIGGLTVTFSQVL